MRTNLACYPFHNHKPKLQRRLTFITFYMTNQNKIILTNKN